MRMTKFFPAYDTNRLDSPEISLLGGLIGTGTASLDVDVPQAWRYIAR